MPDAARTGALVAAQGRMRAGLVSRLVSLIVGMLTAFQRGPRTSSDLARLVGQLTRALEQGDKIASRLGSGLVSQALPTARTSAPVVPSTWTQAEVERIVREWLANPAPDVVEAPLVEHVTRAERAGTAGTKVRGITGWRRVIHPELSRGGTCGLCIAAAAGRVYTTGNLEPIHKGCHCGVLPIVGGDDPGDALNRLDLGDLYDDAGGTTDGWTLKQTRYQVGADGRLVAVKTRKKQGAREPLSKIQRRARQKAKDAARRTA